MTVCENKFCVYEECGICLLEKIKLDKFGRCAVFAQIDIDDDELAKLKKELRKKYEQFKVSPY